MSALRKLEPLTITEFLGFVGTRSEEEKWELIDGVAIMIAPPTIGHQRIARNVERALNDLLEIAKPEWCAEHEVGIEIAQFATFRPEPDVVVVDADIDTRAPYADRFYCVVEVLSKSDPPVIAAKTAFYKAHTSNNTIVLVRQDEVHVTVLERRAEAEWLESTLLILDDVFTLEAIGPVCTLAAIYRGTHLAPGRRV